METIVSVDQEIDWLTDVADRVGDERQRLDGGMVGHATSAEVVGSGIVPDIGAIPTVPTPDPGSSNYASWVVALLGRLRMEKPIAPKPISNIAHVDGSGTAPGLAVTAARVCPRMMFPDFRPFPRFETVEADVDRVSGNPFAVYSVT